MPAGSGSTYPYTHSIGFNQPFAVHNDDPNDFLWYANPNDLSRGIYAPKVQGFNNGYYFSYRTELPMIVRDRLYDCPGSEPDTYYKIPLKGVYSVSQGNNGQFTHNGWQRFAWDFPKLFGTPVVAARGGVVVDLLEGASESCYYPFLPNNDGGFGDCFNCTGSTASNFVYIRHQDGTYAWYGHFLNNGVTVNIGQNVARGAVIGFVGSTGCSTGNHLHFHVVNQNQDQTIPIRFETYLFGGFFPCYLPPSNSGGTSTN